MLRCRATSTRGIATRRNTLKGQFAAQQIINLGSFPGQVRGSPAHSFGFLLEELEAFAGFAQFRGFLLHRPNRQILIGQLTDS